MLHPYPSLTGSIGRSSSGCVWSLMPPFDSHHMFSDFRIFKGRKRYQRDGKLWNHKVKFLMKVGLQRVSWCPFFVLLGEAKRAELGDVSACVSSTRRSRGLFVEWKAVAPRRECVNAQTRTFLYPGRSVIPRTDSLLFVQYAARPKRTGRWHEDKEKKWDRDRITFHTEGERPFVNGRLRHKVFQKPEALAA
jgi:hypothetical protein